MWIRWYECGSSAGLWSVRFLCLRPENVIELIWRVRMREDAPDWPASCMTTHRIWSESSLIAFQCCLPVCILDFWRSSFLSVFCLARRLIGIRWFGWSFAYFHISVWSIRYVLFFFVSLFQLESIPMIFYSIPTGHVGIAINFLQKPRKLIQV